MKSCKEYDYLPYHYSWSRHCGGDWWEFISRSIVLTDSMVLGYVGARMSSAGKLFGLSLGSALLSKSANDMYEAWTGEKGAVRNAIGDPTYDFIGYGLTAFGLVKQVPKKNYLGNPKRDFFIKDPLSYESAWLQYSGLELGHLAIGTSLTTYNDYKKYESNLQLEIDWNKHLSMSRIDYD